MAKKKAGVLMSNANLKRRYPTSGLASEICLTPDNTLWLPSRILSLNWHMGGGLPYGRILEIHGEESTGKSLLANDFAVVTQQLGGMVLWNDAEAIFNGPWAASHGLDLSKVELLPDENEIEIISDWQADMIVKYRDKLKNNEPILLVTDSTAALETRDNMDAADSDSGEDMGRRSKKIYQLLRKRNRMYARYGVCVIYINQIRKKVGATKFEDPDTTPGGMAMRFYASQRLGLYRGSRIKNSFDDTIGNDVFVRTKKNKVAPAKPNIKLQVYFQEHNGLYGYSPYAGLHELLTSLKIIKRKQGKFYYKGDLIANGEAKMIQLINEDAKLRRVLVNKAGINTISKTREKINQIEKNLYPVKVKTTDDE